MVASLSVNLQFAYAEQGSAPKYWSTCTYPKYQTDHKAAESKSLLKLICTQSCNYYNKKS